MKLNFGETEMLISPMSFVECNYFSGQPQTLYIYDYEKDEGYEYEGITGKIIASNDDYSVNISHDKVVFEDGSSVGIFTNINKISNLK